MLKNKKLLVFIPLLMLICSLLTVTPTSAHTTGVQNATHTQAVMQVEKKKKHHDSTGFFSVSPHTEVLSLDSTANGEADFVLTFHDAFGHATFDLNTTLPDGCLLEAIPADITTDVFGNRTVVVHIDGPECVEGTYEFSATENFTPFKMFEVTIHLVEPGE